MRLHRLEKVALALVVALVVMAAFTRPVAVMLSTRFAIWSASPLDEDDLHDIGCAEASYAWVGELGADMLDPWGRPYRFERGPEHYLRVFSRGPDGAGRIEVRQAPGDWFLAWSAAIFGAAAAVVFWAWVVIRLAIAPRSERLSIELARAAGLATVPIAVGTALLVKLPPEDLAAFAPLPGRSVVPLLASAVSFVAFVSVVAALGVRARRPIAAPATSPTGRRGRWWFVLVALVVVGSLVALAVERHLERLRRHRLVASARLGESGAVRSLLAARDPMLLHAFVGDGVPDLLYQFWDDKTLESIAELGSDAVPILVRSMRSGRGRVVACRGRVPIDAIALLDPRFDVLGAEIQARPNRYRNAILAFSDVLGARLGVEREVSLLEPFLDVQGDALISRNAYGMRTCDVAAEKIHQLASTEVMIPSPDSAQSTELWDAVVAKTRVWLAHTHSFEGLADSWVGIHASGLARDARGETKLVGSLSMSDIDSTGDAAGRAWTIAGPMSATTTAVTLRDPNDARGRPATTVNLKLPRHGVVWIDIDFATGAAKVAVEAR